MAENLNLKPKTIGNVAGCTTSIPELLTIIISSMTGLIHTSIFNILSSNIINFIQYIASIVINKNQKAFKNKAIKITLALVIVTILIPIALIIFNIGLNIIIVPIFFILYFVFLYLNNNVHKLYLAKEDKEIENEIKKEEKNEKGNTRKTILYLIILISAGILLYIVGELLSVTLQNLCNRFNISQIIIGILLGIITSVPELITFFESQKHYKKHQNDNLSGVIEATNNLFTSNILNLFIIQSIGLIIYVLCNR